MADNNFNYNGYYDPQTGAYTQNGGAQNVNNGQTRNASIGTMLAGAAAYQHAQMPTDSQGYYLNVENDGDSISVQKFNGIIGVMLLYGFLVNAIMCFMFADKIDNLYHETPFIPLIIYFVGIIVGTLICQKTKSTVTCFIGYNMIVVPMGLLLTPLLEYYEISTIRYAFCIMAVIMLLMVGLSYLYPQFFASIGRMLFACLIIGILAETIMWCVNATMFSSGLFDFLFIGIFAGYIGYDWAVAQQNEKSVKSAIRSACFIYVDLVNLMIRILRIIARNRD
ncbi:MAG: US12 family protein [Lachnospiraceae bacterium]|nr:US12 family protein [Lachnospiraceae bacterium]